MEEDIILTITMDNRGKLNIVGEFTIADVVHSSNALVTLTAEILGLSKVECLRVMLMGAEETNEQETE